MTEQLVDLWRIEDIHGMGPVNGRDRRCPVHCSVRQFWNTGSCFPTPIREFPGSGPFRAGEFCGFEIIGCTDILQLAHWFHPFFEELAEHDYLLTRYQASEDLIRRGEYQLIADEGEKVEAVKIADLNRDALRQLAEHASCAVKQVA